VGTTENGVAFIFHLGFSKEVVSKHAVKKYAKRGQQIFSSSSSSL
tara:strand:+ start:825 stop:959 length:135 start_codon:yes stop_codon:yes gene_type:complete